MIDETPATLDANKTTLTHCVTAAACLYLSARGFKPVETEVPICGGWVADIAGPWEPTMTELINAKMLRRRPSYKNVEECAKWQAEWDEIPALMTGLVEVKTSRADFLSDAKWVKPVPVNLPYLTVPARMIRPDEYPIGWGILEYHESGDVIRTAQLPTIHNVTLEQQRDLIYNVAIRRHHHTEYARHREWQKQMRVRRAEEKQRSKLISLIYAMKAIINADGESAERAFESHGVKCPEWYLKEARALWGVARKAGA